MATINFQKLKAVLTKKGHVVMDSFSCDGLKFVQLRHLTGKKFIMHMGRFKSDDPQTREIYPSSSSDFDIPHTLVPDTLHMFYSHFVHVTRNDTVVYKTRNIATPRKSVIIDEVDEGNILPSGKVIEPEHRLSEVMFEDADGEVLEDDDPLIKIHGVNTKQQDAHLKTLPGASNNEGYKTSNLNLFHRGSAGEVLPVFELKAVLKTDILPDLLQTHKRIRDEQSSNSASRTKSIEDLWTKAKAHTEDVLGNVSSEIVSIEESIERMQSAYSRAKSENKTRLNETIIKAEQALMRTVATRDALIWIVHDYLAHLADT